MSKIVKITNGEVHLKDVFTRGLKKTINKALVKEAKMQEDGSIVGIGIDAIDRANDAAVIGMTAKIIINDKEQDINVETFDKLSQQDFDEVKKAVDEIANAPLPKA